MLGKHVKVIAAMVTFGGVLGCASSTVEAGNLLFDITGTFLGRQDGVADSVSFEDEQIVFLLIERGDSVTGTYDVSGLLGGEFVGTIVRNDVGTFVDFTMTQVDPCAGGFIGQAEARAGVGISGNVTVALAGTYQGIDCDGDVDASFFVQN
jgi:hypothetical protein